MTKTSAFSLALLALLGLFAAQALAAGPMQVAAGVAPVAHFARRIGGEHVAVTVLVPAGADAHTYEPKPSQMRALAASAVYLSAGLEFEQAWAPRLLAANPRLAFVRTDEGLKRLPMPEGHEVHGHASRAGHAEETDPHVWVAPEQVRHMAARIAEAFAKADPPHAKAYAANLAAFLKDVDALDAELRGVFGPLPAGRRTFLVFHPAWGYLAREYGLTQTAIEFEGKEPTPKRLAAIVSQAKSQGVRVVFVQPQMSRRTAETIAQAIGARIVAADPLAEDWEANLRAVARSFREALQ